jgi:urease accessory protein
MDRAMPRITKVMAAAHAGSGSLVDTVILDLAQRRSQRGTFVGTSGTGYDIDLPEPVLLRMGDLLVLDEGAFVEVVAEAEPLIEVRATDTDALARVAWQLGDRHVAVEVLANRLRLRPDAAIEKMAVALGGRVALIQAPFNPEGGAYVVAPSPDHHHHGHAHDHHHHHDDHGHDDHGHDHRHHDHHGGDDQGMRRNR